MMETEETGAKLKSFPAEKEVCSEYVEAEEVPYHTPDRSTLKF
jgi:hypothetical protein